MNICEVCKKEHDGSYGTGRFCSNHCRHVYIAKKNAEKRRLNGTLWQVMQNARSHRTWSNPKEQISGTCQFCGKVCKNQNSLRNYERLCKQNPNAQKLRKHYMPEHTKHYYNRPMSLGNGVVLDVTKAFIDQYRQEHPVCEICGRSVDEVVKTKSKFGPHSLCIDHEHNTNRFRGLLCSVCNRQLGWYEKNKEAIEKYLNKEGS